MHPLITALINRNRIAAAQPHGLSAYWRAWLREFYDNEEFICELALQGKSLAVAIEAVP
jgi:hypothetical protein